MHFDKQEVSINMSSFVQ